MLILLQINWQQLETRIGGERVSSLLWCVGIIIATLIFNKPVAHLITRLSGHIVNRFTVHEDSKLFRKLTQRPMELLLQAVFFYVAVSQLTILLNHFIIHRYQSKIDELAKNTANIFAVSLGDVVDHIFWFLIILFTILLLSRIIDFVYYLRRQQAIDESNKERQQLLPLIKDVIKLILWSIGIFWVLGVVFHVNIPALITGLGIGGVAIALAAKTSVENLFAAFTILADKPFHTGDVVKIGAQEGTVEMIGFRSTRLRSADGSLFVIPNQKFVTESIENLSKRNERRIRVVMKLKYGLSPQDLEKITVALLEMTRKSPHVKEPVEVFLENYEEQVFQLVLSYHLPSPLPDNADLNALKNGISMRAYEIVSPYANIKMPETWENKA